MWFRNDPGGSECQAAFVNIAGLIHFTFNDEKHQIE